jgi:hypothetical protein
MSALALDTHAAIKKLKFVMVPSKKLQLTG